MLFSIDEQIRYSQVNRYGELTAEALVDFFQDCTMLHSETLGHGIRHLEETGEFWLLNSWQIDILRTPKLYEKVKITTSPYEFRGFFGSRNFWMEDADGTVIVKANSVWIYLDFHTHTPKRIPEAEGKTYAPYEPKLEMHYEPRKIDLPEGMEALQPIPVRESQIDTNLHVNNCEYITTALEAAGIIGMPARIRAEYKKAAVASDIFYPFIKKDNGLCTVDLRADDGSSYAILEFVLTESL